MNEYVRIVRPADPTPSLIPLYRAPFGETSYVFDGSRVFQSGAWGGPSSFNVTDPANWRTELINHVTNPGDTPSELVDGIPPGAYYPRMARLRNPLDGTIDAWDNPGEAEILAASQGQVASLLALMQQVVAVVQPVAANMDSYGHEVRNLLILACTEVEAQWKGILSANGYTPHGRFSTNDYVKLEPAMKLSQFAVAFSYFPWLPPFAPFAGWAGSTSPTRDLRWYDDYNAVKHDRETEFHRATLAAALAAVGAAAIMLAAQFGNKALNRPDLGAFFRMTLLPTWEPGQGYVPAHLSNPQLAAAGADAGPRNFPF